MEQNLLIDSGLSSVDGDYELLKALGLIDDEETEMIDDYDKIEADEDDDDDDWDEFETDEEDDNDDRDNYWDPSKMYTGWEDAWNKLYKARLARHRNILLRLFTRRLPNLSEQARNGLFDAFSRSDSFGVSEHNAILNTLAHLTLLRGLSLSKYYELGFSVYTI
jgi:hypothetical protein